MLHDRRSKLVLNRTMMSVAHDVVEPPLAPRAGDDLRAARERLDRPLEAVAAALRIRPSYLRALEAGHISVLPGHAYALGFLRTYARALGLEPEEMVRRFKAEAGEVAQRIELAFPAPVPERGLPAGAVALLGVVLAVGVYIGWYHLSGEGRLPAETVTAVPARLAPLAEQAVPPPAPVVVATVPAPAAPAEPVPPPEPVQTAPSISPTSAAAAPVTPPPVILPAPSTVPSPSPIADASTAPSTAPSGASIASAAAPDQGRIVIRAKADAWIRVRDRSGPILVDRVLHAGDTYDVPPKPNLVLTMGNAGGTELVVDGATMPPLGGPGAVVRDLPLDPDLIKDGKAAPARVSATNGAAHGQ